jgi:hypothetical protein
VDEGFGTGVLYVFLRFWYSTIRRSKFDKREGVKDGSREASRSALRRCSVVSAVCSWSIAFWVSESSDSSRNDDDDEEAGDTPGDGIEYNPVWKKIESG